MVSNGKTAMLADSIYLVFGPRNSILWVDLKNDDFKQDKTIVKSVRLGELIYNNMYLFLMRCNDKQIIFKISSVRRKNYALYFADDFSQFTVDLKRGTLRIVPYFTE